MSEDSIKIHYGVLNAVMEYYQSVPSGIKNTHTRHFQGLDDESMTMQRLGRALSNACEPEAAATYSRFAIWGADMNAVFQEALDALAVADIKSAASRLMLAQKNIRAFIDCFSLLDSQPGHMQFNTVADILNEIKRRMEEAHEDSMPQYKDTYNRICEAINEQD